MKKPLASVFLIAALATAASPLPDSPAGRQAQGWLAVINAGDADGIRKFFAINYPTVPDQGERAVQLSENSGGLEVLKVLESSPTSIAILVRPLANMDPGAAQDLAGYAAAKPVLAAH